MKIQSDTTGVSGVFPTLLSNRAFLDKVVVSIWGLQERSPAGVRVFSNRPIGGPKRHFSRSVHGILSITRNPYELRYGGTGRFPNVPTMMLAVRSEARPITVRTLTRAIDSQCQAGWKAKMSQVEFTFDLIGTSVSRLEHRILTSARKFRTLKDDQGRATLYVGGRTCPWQLRIYDKAEDVVRVEFALKRPFLRQHGINSIGDLSKLKKIPLHHYAEFRTLASAPLTNLYREIGDQRLVEAWLHHTPLRLVPWRARQCDWKLPKGLIVRSKLNGRLRRMQRDMVL